MGTIHLHNYEAFLLDYLDGNLNENDCAELKAFVIAYPELEIDLNDTFLPKIANEQLRADFKTQLIKTEDEFFLNNHAIAYVENQLSDSEKNAFELEISKNIALKQEVDLVIKTKLVADPFLIYPDKEELKKENKVIALFGLRTSLSMAAAILLLLGLGLVFNYYLHNSNNTNNMAKQTNQATEKFVSPKNLVNSQRMIEKQVREKTLPLAIKKTPQPKKVELKNDSLREKKKLLKDSVNREQEKLYFEEEIKKQKHAPETLMAENEKYNQQSMLEKTPEDTTFVPIVYKGNKQTILLASANDDDENPGITTSKKGFWKRAVKLAKQVNQLGIKSIDGNENSDKNYSLSFNFFSVEKR